MWRNWKLSISYAPRQVIYEMLAIGHKSTFIQSDYKIYNAVLTELFSILARLLSYQKLLYKAEGWDNREATVLQVTTKHINFLLNPRSIELRFQNYN